MLCSGSPLRRRCSHLWCKSSLDGTLHLHGKSNLKDRAGAAEWSCPTHRRLMWFAPLIVTYFRRGKTFLLDIQIQIALYWPPFAG
ncbi:MAG: hypothetical protein QOI77_2608 [Blastocatellia bacterium]|nr:hypothetical protein [Blastocatellia bacterium]